MRTFAALTVTGVASVVLFKLFATVILPLLGVLLGLFFLTVKLALIAGAIYFIYSMVRRWMERQEEEVEEEEIEAEVVEE